MPNTDATTEAIENETMTGTCGCDITNSDYTTDNYGDVWCDDCYEEHHRCCDSCSEEVHIDSVNYAPNDEAYCEDCYHENVSYCEGCSEDYWNDDMIYDEGAGQYYCEHCYHEYASDDYEWNVFDNVYVKTNTDFMIPIPTSTYNKDTFNLIKSKRYQGVEIETNYGLDVSNSSVEDSLWTAIREQRNVQDTEDNALGVISPFNAGLNAVYDGSVNGGDDNYGGEIVMLPRRGDILYDDLLTITETLKEESRAYISSKCGYHLHVDIRDFDWQHMLVLTLMTKMIEPHIYSWLPSSRRTSRWCRPVSQSVASLRYVNDRDSFMDYYYDDGSFRNEKYHEKRYHGLNLHCHFQANQGVEIRYHSGTLNADKMLHWSILWTQIIDKCYELGNQLADEMRQDNIYDLSKTNMFQSLTSSRLLNVDRDRLRAISKKYRQAPIGQDAKTNLYEYKQDSDYLADVLGLDTSNTTYLIQPMIKFLDENTNHRHYINPTMTCDSLFETFDIPVITQEFYRKRMVEIMNNDNTPTNHLKNCFHNSDYFVKFDNDNMQFKTARIMNSIFPEVSDSIVASCDSAFDLQYLRNSKQDNDYEGLIII
tara:strand:- start:260 stop:2041 length:1782 start_codon:yes stop_codon:yes gene_type:complete